MTDLIDEKLGEMTGAKKGDTVKKYSGELIALKRTSVPEDVSNTVHFLASGDSDYMTGKQLDMILRRSSTDLARPMSRHRWRHYHDLDSAVLSPSGNA